MLHGFVSLDKYDFLYLAALGAAWYAGRTALSRYRAGIDWRREEIISYGFLVGGAAILVASALLDPLSALRLPIFVIGVGCMAWAFVTLRRIL